MTSLLAKSCYKTVALTVIHKCWKLLIIVALSRGCRLWNETLWIPHVNVTLTAPVRPCDLASLAEANQNKSLALHQTGFRLAACYSGTHIKFWHKKKICGSCSCSSAAKKVSKPKKKKKPIKFIVIPLSWAENILHVTSSYYGNTTIRHHISIQIFTDVGDWLGKKLSRQILFSFHQLCARYKLICDCLNELGVD